MNHDVVLLVLACACFLLSALNIKAQVNLQSAGLALWVLSILL